MPLRLYDQWHLDVLCPSPLTPPERRAIDRALQSARISCQRRFYNRLPAELKKKTKLKFSQ